MKRMEPESTLRAELECDECGEVFEATGTGICPYCGSEEIGKLDWSDMFARTGTR